jgi:hypothetical protein
LKNDMRKCAECRDARDPSTDGTSDLFLVFADVKQPVASCRERRGQFTGSVMLYPGAANVP